jgi:serine/threonine protein kinase
MASDAADGSGIPRPGDVLSGKYDVEALIGRGGMGVVLAAIHRDLGQRVAIKFLSPEIASKPDYCERFLREARAASRIQSEHVARVLDVARTDRGVPYIVMEYLEGIDLDQLVRQSGPRGVAEVVDYVVQACDAIAEAHAAGIVHRDLKPANLFLTRRADGTPFLKVLDFGASKMSGAAETADGGLTAPSDVIGSPQYMSPEQIRSTKNVDHRTDIWSLGVTMHKLLTGTQPFASESASHCLVTIATESPQPLREAAPHAPAALEAVILRCLDKDRNRRFQSVAELTRALLPLAPGHADSVGRIDRVLHAADGARRTIPRPRLPAAPLDTTVDVRPASVTETGSPAATAESITAVSTTPRGSKRSAVAVLAIVGACLATVGAVARAVQLASGDSPSSAPATAADSPTIVAPAASPSASAAIEPTVVAAEPAPPVTSAVAAAVGPRTAPTTAPRPLVGPRSPRSKSSKNPLFEDSL